MLTRAIPKTNEALPAIGLGTWKVFDLAPTPANLNPLKDVLNILFAAGGKVIDSSPMYGRAEEVAGVLLDQMKAQDRAFIATKVWTEGRERGIAQMEESFRLLRTERIDLMQVHNLLDWRSHRATLRDWKAAGRLRYIGITHYTPSAYAQLADIIAREEIDFVQFAYSMATRQAERHLLPLCAERGVATLINRPFETGGLFRKVRGKEVPEWATAFGGTHWSTFFLKYILAHPAVSCVIPATANPDHMREIVLAGEGRLPSEAERARMLAFVEAL
ncbi:MAG TPA: aldo/keto reductase [Alphaproteobacteria bacterium]